MGDFQEDYYQEEEEQTYSSDGLGQIIESPTQTLMNLSQQDFEYIMKTNPHMLRTLCLLSSVELNLPSPITH